MQLSPAVFKAFIDACAEHDMIFFHNDNSWILEHAMQSPQPWSYHTSSPAYYAAKLMENNTTATRDYAAKKLGKRALLSWENNGEHSILISVIVLSNSAVTLQGASQRPIWPFTSLWLCLGVGCRNGRGGTGVAATSLRRA